ncbi:type IV toxin-antitoxin system AbiEi family antitoxin [Microbacterium sp. NPDC090007]|uniref:type IV toxin-antitoxin system AbiEi family antitoxin n=1 Tax=Microbacterium sp. NPDC090007 TaxID=3364204 RepID=UPI0038227929
MVSPFVFFADERLSLAELTAACLDGHLVALGEGFIPADAVETPWMRARSLLPLLGSRWAATRSTAAWIHGAAMGEPSRHHLQRVSATRVRTVSGGRVEFHDVRLALSDVEVVAGVHVTSPTRTLVDLARSDDEGECRLARAWAQRAPLLRLTAAEWLRRHPQFPHGRRATRILDEAPDDVGGGSGGADGADLEPGPTTETPPRPSSTTRVGPSRTR